MSKKITVAQLRKYKKAELLDIIDNNSDLLGFTSKGIKAKSKAFVVSKIAGSDGFKQLSLPAKQKKARTAKQKAHTEKMRKALMSRRIKEQVQGIPLESQVVKKEKNVEVIQSEDQSWFKALAGEVEVADKKEANAKKEIAIQKSRKGRAKPETNVYDQVNGVAVEHPYIRDPKSAPTIKEEIDRAVNKEIMSSSTGATLEELTAALEQLNTDGLALFKLEDSVLKTTLEELLRGQEIEDLRLILEAYNIQDPVSTIQSDYINAILNDDKVVSDIFDFQFMKASALEGRPEDEVARLFFAATFVPLLTTREEGQREEITPLSLKGPIKAELNKLSTEDIKLLGDAFEVYEEDKQAIINDLVFSSFIFGEFIRGFAAKYATSNKSPEQLAKDFMNEVIQAALLELRGVEIREKEYEIDFEEVLAIKEELEKLGYNNPDRVSLLANLYDMPTGTSMNAILTSADNEDQYRLFIKQNNLEGKSLEERAKLFALYLHRAAVYSITQTEEEGESAAASV